MGGKEAKMAAIGLIRRIVEGCGSLDNIAAEVQAFGAQHVLMVTDKGVYNLGLTKGAETALQTAGIELCIESDVPPEPTQAQVQAIFDKAAGFKADLVLAIGGGSAMDTAKLIALMLQNDLTVQDLLDGKRPQSRKVPLIMVPTTAGTGSEATPNAIVLVPEQNLKIGIVSDLMVCDTAILDAKLTQGLPPAITANTGIDALCHLMECYISKKHNPLSDAFCLRGISLIARSLRRAYTDGNDLVARADMLLASCFGGIAIAGSSTVGIHALSYPLGGRYHIPHGLSNAILMPYIMEENAPCCIERYGDIAQAMGLATSGKSPEEVAQMLVSELYAFNRDLHIHCDLKAKGITLEVVDELVTAAAKVTRLLNNNPKDLSHEDMKRIYCRLIADNA